MIQRPTLAAGLVALLAATASACGSGSPTTTRVSGNCALMSSTYRLSPLSARQLEAALGPGTYTLQGTVMTDERTAKSARTPLDGACTYLDANHHQRLTIAVSTKHLPGNAYDRSRQLQASDPHAKPIPGVDGYLMADTADTAHSGIVAVEFRPHYLVSVDLLEAGKGVNPAAAVTTLVEETVDLFGKPVALQQGATG